MHRIRHRNTVRMGFSETAAKYNVIAFSNWYADLFHAGQETVKRDTGAYQTSRQNLLDMLKLKFCTWSPSTFSTGMA